MNIPIVTKRHNKKDGFYKSKSFIKYKHRTGRINVIFWARYNNVEYIFGIPHKTNKYYKQEKAFFEIRVIGRKETDWFYFDKHELEDITNGFNKISYYWKNQ